MGHSRRMMPHGVPSATWRTSVRSGPWAITVNSWKPSNPESGWKLKRTRWPGS